jgi:hypothetical protein
LSKESPVWKTILLGLSIIFASALAGIAFGLFYGFLSAILLPLSVSKYFVTLMFELDEFGVKTQTGFYKKQRPWSYYARYRADKTGVFLSPFASPSKLDSFRGDYLHFNEEVNHESVVAFIRAHLEHR